MVQLARQRRVTRGRTLRVDSTVVETTSPHPTDSRILGDGGRVLSRLLRRPKRGLGGTANLGARVFQTHTRSVRRIAQQVHRRARRNGDAAAGEMPQADRRLLAVATQTVRQARRVGLRLRTHAEPRAARLVRQFDVFLPRMEQAITPAERRVRRGEAVPAKEKIVSLVEPPPQVIPRQTPGKAVEFGRKLWLAEGDRGIVSRYAVLNEAIRYPLHRHRRQSVGHHQSLRRAQ